MASEDHRSAGGQEMLVAIATGALCAVFAVCLMRALKGHRPKQANPELAHLLRYRPKTAEEKKAFLRAFHEACRKGGAGDIVE